MPNEQNVIIRERNGETDMLFNLCEWAKRKGNENTIGRMYSVNPRQVELFHLRLLLSCIKGK